MDYIQAKTIVTPTKSTAWFGTEFNMNIYKGCCHSCIYCDSRSDCYHVEDFDRVRSKKNALAIIRDDLARKVKRGVIGIGSMSDPYNPFEQELLQTRHALELINAYEFGVAIATKSPLVTRDIDLLKDIQTHSPTLVKMTVTTADDDLCRKIERRVAPTSKRFEAIRAMSDQGIYCGILLMPLLPFINDTVDNIKSIVAQAKASGARFVFPSLGVTLRANQRDYFHDRLAEDFPGIRAKYEKTYGQRYQCGSPHARQLYGVFVSECNRLGLLYSMKDIILSYKATIAQLNSLFLINEVARENPPPLLSL